MSNAYNGMPAGELTDVTWQKSRHSNPNGACIEVAHLPGGEIAVRNSRFPSGPALIYTPAEIAAFLAGAKDGEFDHLASELGEWRPPSASAAREHPRRVAGLTNRPFVRSGMKRTCGLCNCQQIHFRNGMITWETY